MNDFVAADEQFDLTTPSTTGHPHHAYFSWDATYLYMGYEADAVAGGSNQIWAQFYFDSDPGAGAGASTGVLYNTQRPQMPSGLGAEYTFAWRADNTYQSMTTYSGGAWGSPDPAPLVTTYQSGTFVEFRIAFAQLGSPTRLGLTSFMLNEQPMAESSFAGLYPGCFTDGYHAMIPLATWLWIDRASAAVPNAPENARP